MWILPWQEHENVTGLPEYNSHNALVDALGAAELLLAQQKRLSRGSRDSFARLYTD